MMMPILNVQIDNAMKRVRSPKLTRRSPRRESPDQSPRLNHSLSITKTSATVQKPFSVQNRQEYLRRGSSVESNANTSPDKQQAKTERKELKKKGKGRKGKRVPHYLSPTKLSHKRAEEQKSKFERRPETVLEALNQRKAKLKEDSGDMTNILKQKIFGFEMLDSLNPLRKEEKLFYKNPQLALQQLQNLYFKDITNFMSLAQELQGQLNVDGMRSSQNINKQAFGLLAVQCRSGDSTPRESHSLERKRTLGMIPDKMIQGTKLSLSPQRGFTKLKKLEESMSVSSRVNESRSLQESRDRRSVSNERAPRKNNSVSAQLAQKILKQTQERNKQLFKEMGRFLMVEDPIQFASLSPNDIYWPVYLPIREETPPWQQLQILQSNHIEELTATRHMGYCKINTTQLLASLRDQQKKGSLGNQEGSLVHSSADLKRALQQLNPWLYKLLLPESTQKDKSPRGSISEQSGRQSRKGSSINASRFFGPNKKKVQLAEEAFPRKTDKPTFLLMGKKKAFYDPLDPNLAVHQQKFRFAFYNEKVRIQNFIRYEIIPKLIKNTIDEIEKLGPKPPRQMKNSLLDMIDVLKEENPQQESSRTPSRLQERAQDSSTSLQRRESRRFSLKGGKQSEEQDITAELKARLAQLFGNERKKLSLSRDGKFGSISEEDGELLDGDQETQANLLKMIIQNGLHDRQSTESEHSEHMSKATFRIRRTKELVQKSLKEMGHKSGAYKRNSILNQVAYAIGNLEVKKNETTKLNNLFDTMIFSKNSEEIMHAARKFLESRKVDLTRFIRDINYYEEQRRKEEADVSALSLWDSSDELSLNLRPLSFPELDDIVAPESTQDAIPYHQIDDSLTIKEMIPPRRIIKPRRKDITLSQFFKDLRFDYLNHYTFSNSNGELPHTFWAKILQEADLDNTGHVPISKKQIATNSKTQMRVKIVKERMEEEVQRISSHPKDQLLQEDPGCKNELRFKRLHFSNTRQFDPFLMNDFRKGLEATLHEMSDFADKLKHDTLEEQKCRDKINQIVSSRSSRQLFQRKHQNPSSQQPLLLKVASSPTFQKIQSQRVKMSRGESEKQQQGDISIGFSSIREGENVRARGQEGMLSPFSNISPISRIEEQKQSFNIFSRKMSAKHRAILQTSNAAPPYESHASRYGSILESRKTANQGSQGGELPNLLVSGSHGGFSDIQSYTSKPSHFQKVKEKSIEREERVYSMLKSAEPSYMKKKVSSSMPCSPLQRPQHSRFGAHQLVLPKVKSYKKISYF